MQITAKNPTPEGQEDQACTVEYEFGKDLAETTDFFTEGIVHSAAVAQFKVGLQSGLRSAMKRGIDPQAYADSWKPGVKAPSISADPMAAAKAAFSQMDDEAKREFLESLKS